MHRVLRTAASVLLAGVTSLSGETSVHSQESTNKKMTVLGRVEKVWIGDIGTVLPAKIDTGARTTSLKASNIETFKRGTKDWVRFTVLDSAGAPKTLERKVVKFQKIKKKDSAGTETRPVVLLRLCVADVYSLTQVNLFDRRQLVYPVLIGRRFLFGKALVNVGLINTSAPRCKKMTAG